MTTTKRQLDSIAALCKSHRALVYFDDGNGLIGVYNHANIVQWYRWTMAGYSLSGSTLTPEGAEARHIEGVLE